jgi:predicted negative regulator of RcsB-dependent stress response
LRPADPQFRNEWRLACRGLKQYDEAEADLRAQLKEQPTGVAVTMELCEVLAAQGKRDEAEHAIADLERAYVAASPDNAQLVEAVAQRHLLYALGDFTALENAARTDRKSAGGKLALFRALIEQNKLDEAAKVLPASDNMAFEDLLGMVLALRLAGRTDDARTWQEVLISDYRSGNAMMRLEANLLEGKAAPTEDTLDQLNMSVPMKAVFVANLAATHPEARERLNAVARTLNVELSFPHYLIERAAAVSP